VLERQFQFWLPQVIAAQVRALLRQGSLEAAAQLAHTHELPMSRARVQLASGDAPAALATLEPLHQQAVEHGWEDERLTASVLRAIAHRAAGELDTALGLLSDALAIAKPGGFIRVFIDEGPPMARLLAEASARGIRPDDVSRLLAALEAGGPDGDVAPTMATSDPIQHLVEPLSRRELEVLHLIAQGLSNREISERLFLALDTVKGHNRVIFGKLMVQRRTEAVARARELGIL
jgi:LuxR family maltose regulon positive regulatory protein